MAWIGLVPIYAAAQGSFVFANLGAPTRIGGTNGPFAGPSIWGRMLAGQFADGLAPVGIPVRHQDGFVYGGIVVVPGIACTGRGYLQLVAWDGEVWGNSIDGVPREQVGKTDTVQLPLNCEPMPLALPPFTRPAIVPVPEPGGLALGAAGGCFLFFCCRPRFRHPHDCVANGTGS
jgi:hypothetical protein